jgi:hypothetical protein
MTASLPTSLAAAPIGMPNGSALLMNTLHTDGPAAGLADKMALYGRFIGSWEMDSVFHNGDGTRAPGPRGRIHFGWVLEGRAIQDVWVLPGHFYGTTLRVYDPTLDAWHILWSDPVKQYYTRQIGRVQGDDIVQEGHDSAGTAVRWSFTEIEPTSFRWIGERSTDGGATWRKQVEFFARRASAENQTGDQGAKR